MHYNILPIGSVVFLKDKEIPMMICGYCSTGPDQPGYVYDYSGFPYPVGCGNTNEVYQFNNEHILRVLALGYQDRESFVFMKELEERMDEIKKKAQERVQETQKASQEKEEEKNV